MKTEKRVTLECGVTVRLVPMSNAIIGLAEEKVKETLRKLGKPVDPPTYTVDLDGKVEVHQHYVDDKRKATTLDVPGDPDKTRLNHMLWNEHLRALEELDAEMGEERVKLYLMFGAHMEWPPENEAEWEATMAYLGREIPSHPLERQALYLTSSMTAGELSDVVGEIQVLMAGNAMSQKDQELFRQGVRGQVTKQLRRAIKQFDDEDGPLGGGNEVPGNASGEGVGPDA